MSTNTQNNGHVVITNKEIYEQVMKLKSQVAAMWVTHGIIVAVLGAALINAIK